MILVTGPRGFVGHKIMDIRDDVIGSPSLRGATEDDIKRIVEESGADVVIHTAAISDVAACAADPDAAYYANVLIPVYLARAAKNIKLVCFSSDQVYVASIQGGPYTEEMAEPGNVYGRQKLEMERRVLDIAPDSVMLRAEWMYDHGSERPNFFMNMINATEPVSFSSRNYRGLTYLKEVTENMDRVIGLPGGIYNFGSETNKSMYELAIGLLKATGRDLEVFDCPPLHNLWMNCGKARKYGVKFSSVEDGLARCVNDYHNREL